MKWWKVYKYMHMQTKFARRETLIYFPTCGKESHFTLLIYFKKKNILWFETCHLPNIGCRCMWWSNLSQISISSMYLLYTSNVNHLQRPGSKFTISLRACSVQYFTSCGCSHSYALCVTSDKSLETWLKDKVHLRIKLDKSLLEAQECLQFYLRYEIKEYDKCKHSVGLLALGKCQQATYTGVK